MTFRQENVGFWTANRIADVWYHIEITPFRSKTKKWR